MHNGDEGGKAAAAVPAESSVLCSSGPPGRVPGGARPGGDAAEIQEAAGVAGDPAEALDMGTILGDVTDYSTR